MKIFFCTVTHSIFKFFFLNKIAPYFLIFDTFRNSNWKIIIQIHVFNKLYYNYFDRMEKFHSKTSYTKFKVSFTDEHKTNFEPNIKWGVQPIWTSHNFINIMWHNSISFGLNVGRKVLLMVLSFWNTKQKRAKFLLLDSFK